jgi:hypothetical protein
VRTLVALVTLSLLVGAAAHAQPGGAPAPATPDADRAEAERVYDEGTKHYDLGEWDLAIAAFKQAYERMPDPLFLFDIAQSYRRAGRCHEARDFYKSFVRDAPAAENRPKADKFIIDMDDCARKQDEQAALAARATPLPRPITAGAEPRLRGLHVAGIATAGAGVLFGVAGGVFSWRANDASRKVETLCRSGCVASAVAELDARGQASDRDAEILYAASGAAIVAGAAMFLWAETHPREPEPVAIAPVAGGGAMVLAHFEF